MTPGSRPDPELISGGMGVHISCWQLARIVSMLGGLGVVSGTALEFVYPRLLQNGDAGGHIRRAFAELSRRQPALAESLSRLFSKYYVEGGKPAGAPYKAVAAGRLARVEGPAGPDSFWESARELQVLTIAANFAEVWLAKEGHAGQVGINFLRKVERPLLYALYGAMLAGAGYVVVGAGNPSEIPGLITTLSKHQPASMALKVYGTGSGSGEFRIALRPETLTGGQAEELAKPKFLAIVSSLSLARALAEDPAARPYGFIVEGPEAGGHSAPPAKMRFDGKGQPVLLYTEEDRADIDGIAALGLPFWLAGSCATPENLRAAISRGASGIQFGTAAALSGQSGMAPAVRKQAQRLLAENKLAVTNTMVSPTGFPFKVAQIPGTISDRDVYESRKRICDIGLLQACYLKSDGTLGYRCPAEPVAEFVAKGGRIQNTAGRGCLCNGLLSAAGLPQIRHDSYIEPPIITLGEDFTLVREMLSQLSPGQDTYTIGKLMLRLRKGLA
jgi:NAD(P)H-dependent flavin oxidoreductase YrpB (nitropropane dioxygenase family)